jgi:hypothetical protein
MWDEGKPEARIGDAAVNAKQRGNPERRENRSAEGCEI